MMIPEIIKIYQSVQKRANEFVHCINPDINARDIEIEGDNLKIYALEIDNPSGYEGQWITVPCSFFFNPQGVTSFKHNLALDAEIKEASKRSKEEDAERKEYLRLKEKFEGK